MTISKLLTANQGMSNLTHMYSFQFLLTDVNLIELKQCLSLEAIILYDISLPLKKEFSGRNFRQFSFLRKLIELK